MLPHLGQNLSTRRQHENAPFPLKLRCMPDDNSSLANKKHETGLSYDGKILPYISDLAQVQILLKSICSSGCGGNSKATILWLNSYTHAGVETKNGSCILESETRLLRHIPPPPPLQLHHRGRGQESGTTAPGASPIWASA